MRILLVGEYSGFHNALKKGLQSLGHQVTLVGDGDGFKGYPVDLSIGKAIVKRSAWRKKLQVGLWRLTGIDLDDRVVLSRFRESEHLLKNHDIIQFINSNPFNCEPAVEYKMIDFLLKNNGKSLLIACGDDVPYSLYLKHQHKGYSILKPEPHVQMPQPAVMHTLKYLRKGYVKNYQKLLAHCDYIIPSNTDYHAALTKEPKATPIIPAPLQTSDFKLLLNHNLDVIEIFMGVNTSNYWKKGINYFEKALAIIKEKYNNRVNITIARDLPHAAYIQAYQNCHILLDQVLCYDQGYNALEAMAQGKVVFAGASEAYLQAHQLKTIPVIDAQPDVKQLVNQLSKLIEHPETIHAIGLKAREHVLNYHDNNAIATLYNKLYTS